MIVCRSHIKCRYLRDQNVATREGVFVNFFGRPACTDMGLAVLAIRSGATAQCR